MKTVHTIKNKKTSGYWLQAINKVSTSFNLASRDINTVMKLILKDLIKELGASAISVWTLEKPTDFMKIDASAGLEKEYIRYFNKTDRVRIGKGIVGKVMVERKTFYSMNIKREKHLDIPRWRKIMAEEGFTALVSAPMFIGKKIVGAFNVYYKKKGGAINIYQRQFIEIIANQIAVTIENIKNYETIEANEKKLLEQIERVLYLQKITDSLALGFYESVENSLKPFTNYIIKLLGADAIAVFRFDKEQDKLFLEAAYGISERHRRFLEGNPFLKGQGSLIGLSILEKKAKWTPKIFVDERAAKPLRILMSVEEKTSLGVFPLKPRGEITGVLTIFYKYRHDFSKEEIGIFSMLADYIGIALMNIRIFNSLAAEKQKLGSMIHSLYDGLIVYDMENRIMGFNARAETFFSVRSQEVIGKHAEALSGDKNIFLENIRTISALSLKNFENTDLTVTSPENKVFRITLVPLRDEEAGQIGSMRIIHDITREKEVELLENNFISVAGHQMRTPLTALKWILLAFLQKELGEFNKKQESEITKAFKSTTRLINIVESLLDITKLEEGRFTSIQVNMDIYSIIEKATELSLSVIKESGRKINFIIDEPPRIPIIATGDPSKIQMALQNIIDNAIKYTNEGSIRVSLEKKEKTALISVIDTGIGIPAAEQKFIFTKFYRAPNAIKHIPEGSGLGLSIAREIIFQNKGKIWLTSELNKGTSFFIELPLASTKN